MRRTISVLVASSCLLGCGLATGATTARVEVIAAPSVCWSGAIGDVTHDGCGNKTLNITSDIGIFAAAVQKQGDDSNPLTVRITPTGEQSKENTTTAAYGVVTVTAGG
jgi:hypothetical protein